MKFDLPQFDLLVPRTPAVLPELVGRLGVNAGLPHVSAGWTEEQVFFKQEETFWRLGFVLSVLPPAGSFLLCLQVKGPGNSGHL